ncbi:hypothetical protein D3C80_1349150 [compost metagenome]
MTSARFRFAAVKTVAMPSVITTAKLTVPLRLAAGLKVQLPSPLSVRLPAAGSTATLCTLSVSPSISLALASSCAAVRV